MAYEDFKDLARKIASDKVLRNKAFNISKYLKYDGYQGGIASMVHKCFLKKSKVSGVNNELRQNEQLAEELYSSFKDNIWGADLADMQLISEFNKGIRFLLYVIDIFRKYA